jgi:hypothetical protein
LPVWNYISKEKRSSGYQNEYYLLKNKLLQKQFAAADPSEQEDMINDIFEAYRRENIFPITYYNQAGITEEILKCINKEIVWEGDTLNLSFNQGQSLCRFFMPNLFDVESGAKNTYTQKQKFYSDEYLKKAISFVLKYDNNGVAPNKVLAGLRLSAGGQAATNFKAMNAKALYERYAPKNAVIYDFASGFGGRLLGALSSKNDYTYIGVEPNTETFANLNNLGKQIEQVTERNNSFILYNDVSENLVLPDSSIDFAFSSPPYFDLERYTDEETQSYNKFPELEDWLEGYVRPTIQNIYKALKPGCFYAVNIADFKYGNKKIEFVNEWNKISIQEGFTFEEKIFMKLTTRTGNRSKGDKEEGIYVFKK